MLKSYSQRALQRYRRRAVRVFSPAAGISGVFLLYGVDAQRRYQVVAERLVGRTVLDVGAGGKSFLSLISDSCVSTDIRKTQGLDVIASATHLPFRSNSIDCVASVDMIEHIERNTRNMVFQEMKRVASVTVVIHVPVENGLDFAGRRYDIAFQEWHKKATGFFEANVQEHIINIEPSEEDLRQQGFALEGTHNADLWLAYMRLSYGFRWPFGLILGQLYYFLRRKRDHRPPFWGAVGVYNKRSGLVDRSSVPQRTVSRPVIHQ